MYRSLLGGVVRASERSGDKKIRQYGEENSVPGEGESGTKYNEII